MLSRKLRKSCHVLVVLCCAGSAQCSTPRPHERYAAGAARDVSRARDAATDAAADVSTDAGQARGDAGDVPGRRDAGAMTERADAALDGAATAAHDATAETEALVREACGELPVSHDSFSREKLREASGRCAMYHYCAFRATAERLQDATAAYASDVSEKQLTAARAAFREAMLRWSRAELFQFGPTASSSMSAGRDVYQGKGLRDRIYAWPAVARCRVEEQLAEAAPNVTSALISARGLFALEYTLHFSGKGSDCAASSQAALMLGKLSDDALRDRKARYAAAVASDVQQQAETLITAWKPAAEGGGDFLQTFTSASGYPSEQEAMNVLGWALIYIEREVKDWKLGIPAGYTTTAPVSLPESPYAQLGSEAMRENLRGFRALFQGCGADGAGLGFDDWLRSAGHGELATDIVAAYERSQRVLDALPPLPAASKPQLEAAYQTLRELTALLKGDLFGAGSPLGLKLPASVEGDTD